MVDDGNKQPHPGIEWVGNRKDCYVLVDELSIVRLDDGSGYCFYDTDQEGNIAPCTPETIDEIIAKLEHFKRVVFGRD